MPVPYSVKGTLVYDLETTVDVGVQFSATGRRNCYIAFSPRRPKGYCGLLLFVGLETLGAMASGSAIKNGLCFFWMGAVSFGLAGCEKPSEEKEPAVKVTPPPVQAPLPEPKQSAPVKAKENTLRFVVVAAGEPLASEKAQLADLRAALEKAKIKVDAAPASADEKQAALDLAAEKMVDMEPWNQFETVVVLELVAPEGSEKGKRVSRGRGHLFIVHPPEKEPTFSTIYETPERGAWLHGSKVGTWLATHLRYRKDQGVSEPAPEKQGPVLVEKERE